MNKSLNWFKTLTAVLSLSFLTLSLAIAQTDTATTTPSKKSSGKQVTRDRATGDALTARFTARLHTSPVWVHETWLDYVTDLDGDGFFHHFRFGFDADTQYADQRIYAELYLINGNEEVLLFESEDFWLTGENGSDAYEITTALDTGYPAQTYDLVLRLYDADNYQLLAELTYLDDTNMANLFLEDAENDTVYFTAPYIYEFTTDLRYDDDGDGFFTNLSMTVDVDAPDQAITVQLGVEIYDPQRGWVSVLHTNDWYIEGTRETDAQTINLTLENGFIEDNYEVRLTLYEALSQAIITTETIGQRLPLESEDYDRAITTTLETTTTTTTSTSVGVSGSGGALGWLALPLLLLLGARRRA